MRLIFLIFFSIFLFASDLNLLLNKLEKEEDLSNLTKQESAGISYIITRYQLDMRQVHFLRDILKNTIVEYNTNRYNLLDPWAAPFLPYSSIGLRVFIDNQEIGSAKYDNGMYLFGNINLDFVDHVEIYYMTPNYRDCIEPSFVIIKLYTKSPKRDKGNKLSLLYDTKGSSSYVFQNANFNNNFSFFTNFSYTKVNHSKYDIKNKQISRDSQNYHFIGKLNFKKSSLLLNVMHKNLDSFMGISLDGAIDTAKIKLDEIHFGYKYKGDIDFKYNLDYTKDNIFFLEKDSPLYFETVNNSYLPIYSLKQKNYGLINTFLINKYFTYKKLDGWFGVDFRLKRLDYPILEKNGKEEEYNSVKKQKIYSFFTENRYQFNDKNIFSFAYKGAKYINDNAENYYLNNLKIGHTYVYNKNNIFKLFYYHFEYPYPLYFHIFYLTRDVKLRPQKGDAVIFKYKKNLNENNKLQLVLFRGKTKHYPYFLKDSNFYNTYFSLKLFDLRYKYIYNEINNFIIDFSKMFLSEKKFMNVYEKFILLNTHRFKKYEFFENFVFRKVDYYDGLSITRTLNLGVKYNYNDNLTFSLKGENLLNSGYTQKYWTYDYVSNTFSPYIIQMQEKKIIANMELLF